MITQKELKEMLHYDPETGDFTWIKLKPRAKKILLGSKAGYLSNDGYHIIKINKRLYLSHRLAWLYITGKWPKEFIDHVNRVKNDNRFINLREADATQNNYNKCALKNNKLGVKGVYWREKDNLYEVRCSVNKKQIIVGYFKDLSLAKESYENFAKKNYGEFYPHQKHIEQEHL